MARVFLTSGENFILSSASSVVFGSTSAETLVLANTATNTVVNSNVDTLSFAGNIADYKFAVQGTNLLVTYNGVTLVTDGIQTDTDGTALRFADITTSVVLTGLNLATIGKATLSTAASTITASAVTGASNIATQAQTFSHINTAIDTSTLLASSNNIVQSLDSGSHWSKTAITYSYNTSIPSEYNGVSVTGTLSGNLTTGWTATPQIVKDATTAIMSNINELTNVNITQVASGGDIRFNMVPMNNTEAAFAYFPGSGIGGDVFIDTAIDTTSLGAGNYGYMTVNHELGHALGLKHPFEDGTVLPTAQDNRVNTIMSYTDYKRLTPTFTDTKNADGSASVNVSYNTKYSDGFMVDDIAALQSIYGANTTANTGNNTYSYGTTPFYHTIWDAGGTDTLDFSLTTHSDIIKLMSGSYSTVNYRSLATQIADQQAKYYADLGTHYYDSWVADAYNKYSTEIYTGQNALGIAYGCVIENAIGGSADDTFYDNSVNNNLSGGAGNDTFYEGAGGFDTIDGGAGADKMVLSVTKASVQLEKEAAGDTLVVASTFAVKLIGVESIQFSDQLYTVV